VASISAALDEVLNRSDDERRHIVSWSVHDRDLIKELSAQRSFRYRNAIPIAKRWRRRLLQAGVIADDGGPNELRWYERLIGYKRPEERFEVGASIAYIRTRTGASPGAVERWMTVVEHNRHDLLAMREVAFRALGLHGFGSQGRQLEG
jgi:hypothetical protein